jgi:antirestriction protein ArdC
VEREIPFLKGYTVFNVAHIDGLPEIYHAKIEPKFSPVERIAHPESLFAATKVVIRYGGNRAYYTMDADRIQMPPIEAFRDAESFYQTLCHETTHWTRHPSRLERDFGRKTWGDEGYAREELVAELGSGFLCAHLELTPEVRDDHAPYIASWLEVLKNDKRCIVQATSYAQKAVDFLISLQPEAKAEAA